MPGARQKLPDDLQDKRRGRYVPLVELPVVDRDSPVVRASIPPFPVTVDDDDLESLRGATRRRYERALLYGERVWNDVWMSPIATMLTDADTEALRHWARLTVRRKWLWDEVNLTPVVLGSNKQPMANPLWRQVRDMDDEIARCEEQFGLTPMARMRLGVTFATGQLLERELKVAPKQLGVPHRVSRGY